MLVCGCWGLQVEKQKQTAFDWGPTLTHPRKELPDPGQGSKNQVVNLGHGESLVAGL